MNIVGYGEPIAWPETVRAAFLHGATVSPEEMARRRRRRRHHTVPIYLLKLFLKERRKRLYAFDQEANREFEAAPRRLLCEKGANTVVDEEGKLRSDVEGVFAHTDSMVSRTVKRIVKQMRLRRNQLTEERRVPDEIELTLDEADQWERDAVVLWCSQRKRNPRNPDFNFLSFEKWFGVSQMRAELWCKMLFNVWRMTADHGAVGELMRERELTVGVARRYGFVVGDELANVVETTDERHGATECPSSR